MGVCEMGIMSEKERVFVRVMKRKSEKSLCERNLLRSYSMIVRGKNL